jgi:hypothetical protein
VSAPRPYPWTALVEVLGEAPFEEIRGDLAAAGTDPYEYDAFVLAGAVGRVLRELVPDDAPAEAVTSYLRLLHALFLHWAGGRQVRTASRERLSARLAAPAAPPPPAPGACYLQLPERLVWAAPSDGAAHEPLDGLFVVATPSQIRVLAVLGFRREREGFTTIDATAPLPAPDLSTRADGSAPFASVLPAGDRMGFHSLTSETELIWLALLALAEAPG